MWEAGGCDTLAGLSTDRTLTDAELRRVQHRLLRMPYEAGCGHIGGNLSSLDCLMLLYKEHRLSGSRFVLSRGHAAGTLYIALLSAGLLSDQDLETFHKDGTKLAGHSSPLLPGVEFATGSLGHGLSLAAGLAFSKTLRKSPGTRVWKGLQEVGSTQKRA